MGVEQSKREDDASLLGAPIEVDVTVAQGSASGAGRGKITVKHNIQRQSLIEMSAPSGDTYCLFAAAELTRLYVSRELNRHHEFPRLLANPERLRQQYILPLLRATGIPEDLPEYNVVDHLSAVQAHYDKMWPGRYELIVFSSYGGWKPEWRGRKDRRQLPLFIYHEQPPNETGHFFGVRSVRSFLGKEQYCTFCETPYRTKADHTFKCKAKCAQCSEVGPNYPCAEEPNYMQPCGKCNKVFRSSACFANHNRNGICNRYCQCTTCGVIHPRSVPHECGSTYCRRCRIFHQRDAGCYIPKLKPAEPVAYRLCIYDFETTQDRESAPGRFEHVVDFISCNTICTVCIAKDRWQRPLAKGECAICGDHRRQTWSVRPFSQTAVCRSAVSETPLTDFVRWLLHEPSKEWTTIALAHNAGRFDAVLVLGELFRQGNLHPSIVRQGTKIYTMEVCLCVYPLFI